MRKIFPADLLARDERFVRLTTEQRFNDPRSPGSRSNPRGAMKLTPARADAPDAARALMHGRYHVSVKDIQALAKPILRHRVMTNFYAESERVTSDSIVERLIDSVPLPKSGM